MSSTYGSVIKKVAKLRYALRAGESQTAAEADADICCQAIAKSSGSWLNKRAFKPKKRRWKYV